MTATSHLQVLSLLSSIKEKYLLQNQGIPASVAEECEHAVRSLLEVRPIPPRGQSRRASLCEAITNVSIGFGISILANYFILPLWGFAVTPRASLEIGLVFTLISVLRSYLLRRLFNLIHLQQRIIRARISH